MSQHETNAALIEFEIDGKTMSAPQGKTIIEVCDDIGTSVPRFCYHPSLSSPANCRQCLVDVEGVAKPLPACVTTITPGMKIKTKCKAQQDVMEFLLVNHPLDCPICDQGGECELQDVAMGFGKNVSRLTTGKRSVSDENLGPLVHASMTLCIHCTRCVRFGEEIAGVPELGETQRGGTTHISTYLQKGLTSELSGNVIDICPVGALTSKVHRHQGRSWEYQRFSSIAPHDAFGSHMYLHVLNTSSKPSKVMRAIPKPCPKLNEQWLDDRSRFSYQALNHPHRLKTPLLKQGDRFVPVSWQEALDTIIIRLSQMHKDKQRFGLLCSENMNIQNMFVLQHYVRSIGHNHIDYRYRQSDFSQPISARLPAMDISCQDLTKSSSIILLFSYLRHEMPMLNHWVRQAVSQGAKVQTIHALRYDYNYATEHDLVIAPQQWLAVMIAVAQRIAHVKKIPSPFEKTNLQWTTAQQDIIDAIALSCLKPNAVMVLGQHIIGHRHYAHIKAITNWIERQSNSHVIELSHGANAHGANVVGMIPHGKPFGQTLKRDVTSPASWDQALDGYWLQDLDPHLDVLESTKAMKILNQASFVVACNTFDLASLRKVADIILPIASFAEDQGALINILGQWQDSHACQEPVFEQRRTLDMMIELMQKSSIEMPCDMTFQAITNYIKTQFDDFKPHDAKLMLPTIQPDQDIDTINCYSPWPMMRNDSLLRHAQALSQWPNQYHDARLRIHGTTADRLKLQNGSMVNVCFDDGHAFVLRLLIDDTVALNTVYFPASLDDHMPSTCIANVKLQGVDS